MLRSINKLKNFKVKTSDGEIGGIDYFFFDDETWTVRYLVVNTGNWLTGRQVLISPYSINHLDWVENVLDLSLTKEQVEGSPEIDVLRPISRQQEAAFLNYYDYPYYWGSAEPLGLAPELRQEERAVSTAVGSTQRNDEIPTDSHLRSTQTVSGYHIAAQDGDIGHVEDFVIDDEIWAVRYLVIATRNWWPGKKVIVAPQWITAVDWRDSKVHVNLTREAIKGSPEFSEATLISREYENQLYRYYGRPGYWDQ
jgi:sporulation protein YlmC with PRC-barrel domain